MYIFRFTILCFILNWTVIFSAHANALDPIRERGHVLCGVDEQLQGFAALDQKGRWQGIEVDYCRALASALFGTPDATKIIPLNAQTRFSALKSGAIDVLMRTTGKSYARERFYNLRFPAIMMIDQLGALVHKDKNIKTLDDIKDVQICVNEFSTSHDYIRSFINAKNAIITVRKYNSRHGAQNVFFAGQCDIYMDNQLALEAMRRSITVQPENYSIFTLDNPTAQIFGPVTRAGEDEWFDLVKWTMNSLLYAESLGLTQEKVSTGRWQLSNASSYFMGGYTGLGDGLELQDKWAQNVIANVGHYGEIFERHLGVMGIERGPNRLWSDGGSLYPIPMTP